MEFCFGFIFFKFLPHCLWLSGSHISADQLLELLWETKNMNNKHCEKDSNPESEQNKEMEDLKTREKLDYRSQQGMYAYMRTVLFI